MDSITDYAKQETLLAMYRSVERMNDHLANGNPGGAILEKNIQMDLRSKFEELSNEPAPPAE